MPCAADDVSLSKLQLMYRQMNPAHWDEPTYLQGHQHVQWSHAKHDLRQGGKEASSYLEDPVNASADVGKGLHEGVKACLAHGVEGVSGCLGLLLCLLQLLHAAPLTFLHNRLQLITMPPGCLQMQNYTKSNDPDMQHVPPDVKPVQGVHPETDTAPAKPEYIQVFSLAQWP